MMRYCWIFLLFGLLSCEKPPCGHSKADLLDDMEELSDEVEDRENLSDNELEEMEQRVKKLTKDCYESYENDLTQAEKRQFWSHVTSFYLKRHGLEAFSRLSNDLDHMAETLSDNIGKWMDGTTTDLEKWIEDFQKEDLEELKDELKEDLEKWQQKIEEMIEEEIPNKSE